MQYDQRGAARQGLRRSSRRSVGCNCLYARDPATGACRSSRRSVGCNFAARDRDPPNEVAPRAGAWVAICLAWWACARHAGRSSRRSVGCNNSVARHFSSYYVAPRAGAWVAISEDWRGSGIRRSLLAQERGLQSCIPRPSCPQAASLLAQERGLQYVIISLTEEIGRSLLAQERGLQ